MHTLPDGTPGNGIAKVRYSHDAMIDLIMAEPGITQREVAKHFGYSEGWISQVFTSDAFQARLAERREELVDPLIIKTIEERLKAVADRSLQVVLEKLEPTNAPSGDFALKAAELASKALGYGARERGSGGGPAVAVVVNVPPRAASSEEWTKKYTPETAARAAPLVVEVNP